MYLNMNPVLIKPCGSTLKITKKLSIFQGEQISKVVNHNIMEEI